MKKNWLNYFAIGAATMLLGSSAFAREISVPNGSFESPQTPLADPRIDLWQKAPQPPGFDPNTSGPWDNLVGVFVNPPSTNAEHIDNAEGNQLAYLFNYPQ